MTTDTDKTKDTDKGQVNPDPKGQQSVTDPTPPKQKTDTTSSNDSNPPATKTFTEEELNDRVSKARSDEKSKVYDRLEAAKNELKSSQGKIAELETLLQDKEKSLDDLRQGRASEVDSIAEELKLLREHNSKLEKAIETVAEEAESRIYKSELKVYRERQIRAAGLSNSSVDLVQGSSEEEIDTAIKRAQEIEAKLKEEVRESVRKEMAANLPSPISPDGSHGNGPTPTVTHQNREALASIRDKDEYVKRRNELLEEAKRKAGLIQ